jgi:hypothetical protein
MQQKTERFGEKARLSKMRERLKYTYNLTKKIFNLAS